MIYFDHCYTEDVGHKFHKRLERLGFKLNPKMVEHPGKRFCRFVMFANDVHPRTYNYLEFIWAKKVKTGKPGFCFGYSGGLKRYHQKLESDGRYKSKFIHKNYDWKKDSRSALPGWNFVTFEKLGLSHLFPWFTEYEPSPKRKNVRPPKHKNGALKIHGFVFDIEPRGESFLSYLLGKTLTEKTRLSGGTYLYVSKAKRTRLRAVVIEMKSLPAFLRKHKPDSQGVFFGRDAARIENPDRRMWDLILI